MKKISFMCFFACSFMAFAMNPEKMYFYDTNGQLCFYDVSGQSPVYDV